MSADVTKGRPTPLFDELYDCARRLGTCEVVVERVPYRRRRAGLAVVVRRTDDETVVHRAVAQSSVEDAAARIRRSLERAMSGRDDCG